MGLSNEERHQKVIWSVHNLTKLSQQIDTKDTYWSEGANPYIGIKNLIEQMWPELLSGKGDSRFWLLGSDENVTWGNCSLWSIALYNHIAKENSWEDELKEKSKATENDRIFDCVEYGFTIESLLEGNDRLVYKIKAWLEHVQYATNRYKDEVSEQYQGLNNLVAKCHAHMFDIWNEDEKYAKVWLITEIAKLLLGDTSYKLKGKADELQTLVNDKILHHNIRSGILKCEIGKLKEVLWSLTEDSSIKNRLFQIINVAGNKLSKHHEKDIQPLAKKYKIKWIVEKPVKEKEEVSQYKRDKIDERRHLLTGKW